jgi:hypothetical protein
MLSPHIVHCNDLAVSLSFGRIRGIGEIWLLRVDWFFIGSIIRWWDTQYVIYEHMIN